MSLFPSIGYKKLREELDEILVYSQWLLSQMDDTQNNDIKLHLKKDAFVHFGSIIEGILFYVAEKSMEAGKISPKVVIPKYETLYLIEKNEELNINTKHIALITEKIEPQKLKNIDFNSLIETLYDESLFSKEDKKLFHEIRNLRNSVHASKHFFSDEKIKNKDIKEYMETMYIPATKILKRILEEI